MFLHCRRFVLVMEGVYGKDAYARSGHPDWCEISAKPYYVDCAHQGFNECGYYLLQNARTFDGDVFVEHIAHQDVSLTVFR